MKPRFFPETIYEAVQRAEKPGGSLVQGIRELTPLDPMMILSHRVEDQNKQIAKLTQDLNRLENSVLTLDAITKVIAT